MSSDSTLRWISGSRRHTDDYYCGAVRANFCAALRVAGAVLDRAGRFLFFDMPFTWAGMGITDRDPQETVADTFEALRG
jgi:hypothetical protein